MKRYLVVYHGRFGDKVEQYTDLKLAVDQFHFAKVSTAKTCPCSIPAVSLCEVIDE